MADANYRPAAPCDGMGNITLTPDQYDDRGRLYREAVEYALTFSQEDDKREFRIGCSNFSTNRAFVLAIEARAPARWR